MNKSILQAIRSVGKGTDPSEYKPIILANDLEKQRWSTFTHRFLSRYINATNEVDLIAKIDILLDLADQQSREELCWNTIQKTKALHPRIFGLLYKHCKSLFNRKLPDSASITIVIPTYNRDARLNACLRHLLSYRLEYLSIYIRDNASSDKTREVVKAVQQEFSEANIEYAANTTNVGWLRNYLVTLSSHEYDCCIVGSDDDLIPEEMIAYSLWFYFLYPEYGLLYFDKRKHLRHLYQGTGGSYSSNPSHQSLSIVKSVNTFGGMVVNSTAFKKYSSRFYSEKNLMGHYGFALAVSQEYPVASISIDRFDPIINKFANLSSSSGINTSLNWDNISAMIEDGSIDHSFYVEGFARQSFGNILYFLAYGSPHARITDSVLAVQYLSYVNPWWQAWVGHRVRTFSLEKPAAKSYLITVLRLLRPQYIHNTFILSNLAVIFDARYNELPEELHVLFNAIIHLTMSLKIHVRHHYDAQPSSYIIYRCLGSLGKLVSDGLSIDEAITIAKEELTPYQLAILNCDPNPIQAHEAIRNSPYYGSGYHQDAFTNSAEQMLSKDNIGMDSLIAANETLLVRLMTTRARTTNEISDLIISMLADAREIIKQTLTNQ
jgi:glycosyltransferase involved in cell wall biosynthesis